MIKMLAIFFRFQVKTACGDSGSKEGRYHFDNKKNFFLWFCVLFVTGWFYADVKLAKLYVWLV